MNVSHIRKKWSTYLLGALTLITFIWFAKVDSEGRAETLLKQPIKTINQEQLGPVQLNALPDSIKIKEPEKKKPVNKSELNWLAKNIYHEARGQSIKGQYAVAIVTLNRVKSGKFPESIEKVVTQPGQFSWYHHKTINKITESDSFEIAKEIARNVLEENGTLYKESNSELKGALYFCEKRIKTPKNRKVTARIGSHIFYI